MKTNHITKLNKHLPTMKLTLSANPWKNFMNGGAKEELRDTLNLLRKRLANGKYGTGLKTSITDEEAGVLSPLVDKVAIYMDLGTDIKDTYGEDAIILVYGISQLVYNWEQQMEKDVQQTQTELDTLDPEHLNILTRDFSPNDYERLSPEPLDRKVEEVDEAETEKPSKTRLVVLGLFLGFVGLGTYVFAKDLSYFLLSILN